MNTARILATSVDLIELFKSTPDIFNLDSLTQESKLKLLEDDFHCYFPFMKLTANDKAFLLLNSSSSTIQKNIILTEKELTMIPDNKYVLLLQRQFKKYIRKERYLALNKTGQREVFVNNSKWVDANIEDWPELTSYNLQSLAHNNPSIIEPYLQRKIKITTNEGFWHTMIKFDSIYKQIFIERTKTLLTKNDVRGVVQKYPEIIKLIDEKTFTDSKLTVKEWLALIYKTIGVDNQRRGNKNFKNWKFSKEMSDLIRLDLMSELLVGKSSTSVHLSNAIEHLLEE